MIDLASTNLSRYSRLANTHPPKYGLFAKFSLAVAVAYEVDENPHIFPTRENQHIQEINRHFDGTLNNFGPMEFSENQEKKDMLLQQESKILF